MPNYDIIIIGSGPSGSYAAEELTNAGKKVAVVDELFGGTCALKGCTPKKAMETVSTLFWETKELIGKGFTETNNFLDWSQLLAHQKQFTEMIPQKTIDKFEALGIDCIQGRAVFSSETSIKVAGKEYQAETIIIATGAKERNLTFSGSNLLKTTYDFFNLNQLPERITFVGAGYVAFELSHIAAACGTKVTIINDSNEFLTQFDSGFADRMFQATLEKGIDIILNAEIKEVAKKDGSYSITYTQHKQNNEHSLVAGEVFHSAGRVPNLANLSIEKAGLSINQQKGLATNRYLKAEGNKQIYGMGDVLGNLPFTETANYEAQIVVNNILNPDKLNYPNYKGMPMVLFTHPKMSTLGKLEKELKEENVAYEVKEGSMKKFLPQRAANNGYAYYKILIDKETKKILGANLIGLKTDDMINIFALAVQNNISFPALNDQLLAYPTATHDVKGFD